MERKKYICHFLISILCSFGLYPGAAQKPNNEKIYNAYITGNMKEWLSVIENIENKTKILDKEKLELLNYYYGYIGFLIGSANKKTAKEYISKGETLISGLLKDNPENPELLAYKGSFIGFKMGINKLKAVVLGPESMRYIQRAYDLNPEDIQAVADKANMLYYAPPIFGGDKKEAIALYQKAINLLEINKETENNWFYLNLLATLAQQFESMNQFDNAITVYEKALQFEPDFKWVLDELYPHVKNKSGK